MQPNRIETIDIARFYAMILVYYGHIIEQVMYLGSAQAAVQYKFIYSFHMPLFFFLSGCIASGIKLAQAPGRFIIRTLASRLPPYILFSLMLGIASLYVPGWFPLGDLAQPGGYTSGIFHTLSGFPAFCIPMWFMALLVSVEVFHYMVVKWIHRPAHLALAAAVIYTFGYCLNQTYNFVGQGMDFWFIHEVPAVYLFYAAGVILKKSRIFDSGRLLSAPRLEQVSTRIVVGAGALACLVLTLATWSLNTGPFRLIPAVVIVLSGHGHALLFAATAFTGSFFILFLAGAGPRWPWLGWMGKNALSLFCLNGVFYHFVNPVAARWIHSLLPMTHLNAALYSTALTAVSLVVCVPLIFLLTRLLPQLMGKPATKGPVLPAIIRI